MEQRVVIRHNLETADAASWIGPCLDHVSEISERRMVVGYLDHLPDHEHRELDVECLLTGARDQVSQQVHIRMIDGVPALDEIY